MTGDQYPVGELGPKMGGVLGKNYLCTQGLSSNIPLTGLVNIVGKPITVLFKNSSVWGCGMVHGRLLQYAVHATRQCYHGTTWTSLASQPLNSVCL